MNSSQQLPPNYLDDIAPKPQKTPFIVGRKYQLVFIGIIAVILVIIVSVTVGAITSSRKEPWEQLSARIATTKEVAESSQGKIKNSQLRSTNSNLKIALTNAQRDLTAPLTTAGVNPDPTKLSQSVMQAESSAPILERLEDARLNAKYDSAYAREMRYQVTKLLTVLRQLYNSSSNEMNKTYLKTTFDNLQPVEKSLSEFSASNE